MSNLIVTIISIALVVAMALAGVYYGGAAFEGYLIRGKVIQLLTIMEQIRSAAQIWKTNNFAEYPTADPTGEIADCASNYVEPTTGGTVVARNVVLECWVRALTYNGRYLDKSLDMTVYPNSVTGAPVGASGQFDTRISFGRYGAMKTGTLDGFPNAAVKIDTSPATSWPTASPVWYVRWLIQVQNYEQYNGGTSGVSLEEIRIYVARLCHEINRQLGAEKPDGTYPSLPAGVTINSNSITNTNYAINLPSANISSLAVPNLCVVSQSSGNLNDVQVLLPL